MSNIDNQFLEGHTPAEFLTLFGDLLQGKFDKRGGTVAGLGNNIRAGANRANLIDDLLLLVGAGQLGDVTPAFEYHDTGEISIDSISTTGGGTPVYAASFDITTGHNMFEMYAVSYYLSDTGTPIDNVDGLDIEFFQDSGLTRRYSTHTLFRQGEDQMINPAGNTITIRGHLMFETAPSSGVRRVYFRFTNNSASVAYTGNTMRIWGRLFTLTETIIPDL